MLTTDNLAAVKLKTRATEMRLEKGVKKIKINSFINTSEVFLKCVLLYSDFFKTCTIISTVLVNMKNCLSGSLEHVLRSQQVFFKHAPRFQWFYFLNMYSKNFAQ